MRINKNLTLNGLTSYYLYGLAFYTIFFSIADIVTNKYYHRIWHKKTVNEKFQLIFLLFFHNLVYFTIYFSVFYIVYGCVKNVDREGRSNLLKFSIGILVYFLYTSGTLIHWRSNDNKCELTDMQNKLLEISADHGFRDWYSILTSTYPISTEGDFRSNLYYAAVTFNAMVSFFVLLRLAPRLL